MLSTRAVRAGRAIVGLLATGLVGFIAWQLVEDLLARRAIAAHNRTSRAYAARLLERIGTVPPELSESSGLAVSRSQPGVLWSHNDSGDGPNLYAIDVTGRLLAIVPVMNASAQDWEDLSLGPCPDVVSAGSSSCLYIADTGNNDRSREVLTIYVLVEPTIDRSGRRLAAVPARSFRFRYPGRTEDSEALAVRPSGDVTIVSKGRTGSIDFYGFSASMVSRAIASTQVIVAEYRGNTGIRPDQEIGRWVTGAAVSPDGMVLAVRTYNEVFFYRATDGAWQDLKRPCFLDDAEPQGEAIAYLDEDTLLLTSEEARGRRGTIHRLKC